MSGLNDSLDGGKQRALQSAGFRWLDDNTVWVQPETRQVISSEWAQDHSLADLEEEIRDRPAAGDWSFRSIRPMSDATQQSIIHLVEGRHHSRRRG